MLVCPPFALPPAAIAAVRSARIDPRRLLWAVVLASLCALPAAAGEETAPPAGKQLSLDLLYSPDSSWRVDFSGDPVAELGWLDDERYLLLARRGSAGILTVAADSGDTEALYDAAAMEAALAALPGVSGDEARALAHPYSFEMAPEHQAALVQHAGDLFIYRFTDRRLTRLTHGPEEEREAAFSPDGRWVSFVRGGDLHLVPAAGGDERRLTDGGGGELLNGLLDWVYQEEIYGRGDFKGYWWSPDSARIAFLQLDTSRVPRRGLSHFEGGDEPGDDGVDELRYPRAGEPNPEVALGVVPAVGGAPYWIDLARYRAAEPLVVQVGWSPDGGDLVYQVQDRRQRWLELVRHRLERREEEVLVREEAGGADGRGWVSPLGEPRWLADGGFLWLTEASGFRSVERRTADGSPVATVAGPPAGEAWEVRSLECVDEEGGWVYFVAGGGLVGGGLVGDAGALPEAEQSRADAGRQRVARHLYRAALTPAGSEDDGATGVPATGVPATGVPATGIPGPAAIERISTRPGSHRPTFSPGCGRYLDRWSDHATPPQLRLHRADGRELAVIDANPVPQLAEYRLGEVEYRTIPAADGHPLPAMIIRPPDFEPETAHPVLLFTYGGPGFPLVRDGWLGSTSLWHHWLATQGMIVVYIDPRVAGGPGIREGWPAAGRLGELALADLEAAVAWLTGHPWADRNRVALWGWSYGGFMTAYAMTHSRAFRAGVAGAAVTDWRLYDSVYTERYMGLPQDNPEGYEASSAIAAAGQLSGKLLLIHGTRDDNVHPHNSLRLAGALQRAGRDFEMMLYPGNRHAIFERRQRYHLQRLMTDFLLRELEVSGREIAVSEPVE